MNDQHEHPSGLHIHTMFWENGHLAVDLATGTGRNIRLEIEPTDHPQLLERFVAFTEGVIAAAETVMLDIVGLRGSAPDSPEDLMRSAMCYVCGAQVSTTEPPGRKVYCEDHRTP